MVNTAAPRKNKENKPTDVWPRGRRRRILPGTGTVPVPVYCCVTKLKSFCRSTGRPSTLELATTKLRNLQSAVSSVCVYILFLMQTYTMNTQETGKRHDALPVADVKLLPATAAVERLQSKVDPTVKRRRASVESTDYPRFLREKTLHSSFDTSEMFMAIQTDNDKKLSFPKIAWSGADDGHSCIPNQAGNERTLKRRKENIHARVLVDMP